MARIFALAIVAVFCCSGPAQAQSSRVYVAGTAAADSGSRGPVSIGTVGTTGGILGVRLSPGWSVEVHADRGFGEASSSSEGLWSSSAPAGATTAEIERLGVFARHDRSYKAENGYSALAVWNTRQTGRVNVALSAGVSTRFFKNRVVRTITRLPEDVSSDDRRFQNGDESRTFSGGGITGGVLVPIRVAGSVTVAPELRLSFGRMNNGASYSAFHTGVRLMWGF
jgi:hypothetical protein